MKPTPIVTFAKSATRFVAECFGFTVKGTRLYRKYPGLPVTCSSCGKLLSTRSVGNFAKGKKVKVEVYCDNPVCLCTWIAENKMDSSEHKRSRKRKKVI